MTHRHSKSPPKYCLHKATGQARVTIAGRDHYLGPYGSPETHERYAGLVATLKRTGSVGRASRDATVTELIASYWLHCKEYYVKAGRPTHTQMNIRCVLKRLRQLFGSMSVNEFGPAALKTLRQSWLEDDLAVSTINYKVACVRDCFKWGVAEEIVDPMVLVALGALQNLKAGRCAARPPRKIAPVADDVVDRTLEQMPRIPADMVRVQRLVGCRPGEVCQMRTADFDTSNDVWEYRPSRHKTEHRGKDKVYLVGPRAQAILREYLRTEIDAPIFSPRESERLRAAELRANRKSKLTPSQRERSSRAVARATKRPRAPALAYTTDSFRRVVQRAAERAGVSDWHPHQLRHTRATEVRGLFGLDGAAAVLGNTIEAAEIYADRNMALARTIAARTG